MDHSVTFARHFARLTWLLLEQPDQIDEQKAALRALVTVSRMGPVTLAARDGTLVADGVAVPALPGGPETAARLARHGVRELHARAEAAPADLLAAARTLAAEPAGDAGAPERLRASGATTVHLLPVAGRASFDEFELVSDEELGAAIESRPARASGAFAAEAPPAASGGLFGQFAAAGHAGAHAALLAALDAAQAAGNPLPVLDQLSHAAEQALRASDLAGLATLLAGVVAREAVAGAEWRRDYAIALRRLLTGHALRQLASQLPRRTMPKEEIGAILARAGEDGADAVIEQLVQAETAPDRRAYYEMLLTLRAGIPALIHMLGDSRWYVVRNAADLLGEMGAREAEPAITGLLAHADARVRRSATEALLRLDTGTARASVHRVVQQLIDDAAPGGSLFRRKPAGERAAAVAALGDAPTPAALEALRALAKDRDREVREAALKALANARRTSPRGGVSAP